MATKRTVELQIIVDDKGTTKKLKVDADQLENALAKTGKQQKNFRKQQRGVNQTAQSGSKNFANLTGGIMSGGGLVAAYATLAAQIFAVTAAFGFLKDAGSLAQLQSGQLAYAGTVGTSIKSLTENIIEATDAQITFRDAAQAAAIGTAAGLSSNQLERLGSAAKTTSLVLGRDLTDSFNRLIRGVTKAEPELLDELGIILRLETATEKYGRKIGKTAKDLSVFERSQAVANDVLGQVDEKFGSVADSSALASNEFAKLGKSFDDLVNKIRTLAVELAGPVAQLLQDFPQLIALAFAPFAAQVVGAALPQLATLGDKLEETTGKAERMFDKLSAKQTEFNQINAIAADPKKATKDLEERGKAVFEAINKEEKLRKNSILNRLRDGENLKNFEIKRLRGQLNKEDGLYASFNKKRKRDLLKLLKEMELNNKASSSRMTRDVQASVGKMKLAFTSLGVTATKTFTKMAGAAAVAGRVISSAFSFLSIISTIALVGSLIFSFFRTKEQVDQAQISLDKYKRTLENVNKEYKVFEEQQLKINNSQERGLHLLVAFGNRLNNVNLDILQATLGEIDNKPALGIAKFNEELNNAKEALDPFLARVKGIEENLKDAEKRFGKTSAVYKREVEALAKAQAKYLEKEEEFSTNFARFIRNSDDASEELKLTIKFLDDTRTFLQKTDNAYIKAIPNVKDFAKALDELIESGKPIPERLRKIADQIINVSKKAAAFQAQQLTNIQDLGKVMASFIPASPIDNLVAGLDREANLIKELEKDTTQLLDADKERLDIIEGQLTTLKQIRDNKLDQLKMDTAIDVALKRSSLGLTKNLQERLNLSGKILKENAKIIKAEQEIENIKNMVRIAQEQNLKLEKEETAEAVLRRQENQKIIDGKGRAIQTQVLAIEKAEAELEVLKRQNTEIKQIQDGLTQALETNLQTQLARVLKGQEGQIIDAIRNIAKGIGFSLADILSKQVTTDIMQKLLKIKSPQALMKNAIEAAFDSGETKISEAIKKASVIGAESYKEAIITASGGNFTSTLGGSSAGGPPAGGMNPNNLGAGANVNSLINRLIGKGSQTGAETDDENTPGANTGVAAGSGVIATQRGIFRDFIDDFASLFKNDGQSFILKLGKTFLSGSLAFKDLLTSLISGVGSILGSAGSGIFGFASSLFFRYGGRTKDYSTGGIARGPQSGYPAMLHGNEAVVPLPDGNKIPVDLGAGAGGVNNVSVNVNIASDGQATTEMTGDRAGGLGKAVAIAVQEELQRQKRPGGILSPFGAA